MCNDCLNVKFELGRVMGTYDMRIYTYSVKILVRKHRIKVLIITADERFNNRCNQSLMRLDSGF